MGVRKEDEWSLSIITFDWEEVKECYYSNTSHNVLLQPISSLLLADESALFHDDHDDNEEEERGNSRNKSDIILYTKLQVVGVDKDSPDCLVATYILRNYSHNDENKDDEEEEEEEDDNLNCFVSIVTPLLLCLPTEERTQEDEEDLITNIQIPLSSIPLSSSIISHKWQILLLLDGGVVESYPIPRMEKRMGGGNEGAGRRRGIDGPPSIRQRVDNMNEDGKHAPDMRNRGESGGFPSSCSNIMDLNTTLLHSIMACQDFQWSGSGREGEVSSRLLLHALKSPSFQVSTRSATSSILNEEDRVLYVLENCVLDLMERIVYMSSSEMGGGVRSERNISNKLRASKRVLSLLSHQSITPLLCKYAEVPHLKAIISRLIGYSASLAANHSLNSLLDDVACEQFLRAIDDVVTQDEEEEEGGEGGDNEEGSVTSVGLSYIDSFFLNPSLLPNALQSFVSHSLDGLNQSINEEKFGENMEGFGGIEMMINLMDALLRSSMGLYSSHHFLMQLTDFKTHPISHWLTNTKSAGAFMESISDLSQILSDIGHASSPVVSRIIHSFESLSYHYLEVLMQLYYPSYSHPSSSTSSSDVKRAVGCDDDIPSYPLCYMNQVRCVVDGLLDINIKQGNHIIRSPLQLALDHHDFEGLVHVLMVLQESSSPSGLLSDQHRVFFHSLVIFFIYTF